MTSRSTPTLDLASARLAVLRIGFALCLAHDVADLWQHAGLWYGEARWPSAAPTGVRLALGAWCLTLLVLAAGAWTRVAALVNWGFSVVFLGFHSMRYGYEYHNDNVYIAMSAALVVLPTAQVWSIDARRRPPLRRGVSAAGETFVALVAAGLYLDSALWKLSSSMWLAGLGYWTPASQPSDAWLALDWTLEHEGVARALGYGTLVYELLFVGLVWWRRARWPLLAFGAGLHIGIATLLPLPRFGVMMLVFLAVLAPIGRTESVTWTRAARVGLLSFYAWWAVLFALGLRGPLASLARGEHAPPALTSAALQHVERWSYRLLGMRSHPIFLDSQFEGYEQETRVCFVPDGAGDARAVELGTPRFNRHWVSWCYRLTWPAIPPERLADWLERYVAHHAAARGLDLTTGHVRVERRALDLPIDHWRPGVRRANLSAPWVRTGTVMVVDGAVEFEPGELVASGPP